MTNEIQYARLGKESFIAGVSLEAITADAENIHPGAEIVPVERAEIPKEYEWSIRKVEGFSDWRKFGTYLLIRDFETYGETFKRYFPNETGSN